jgi:carboxypeptidase C (cathepsin A)
MKLRVLLPLLLIAAPIFAQRPDDTVERPMQTPKEDKQAPAPADKISTTQHTLTVGGQTIAYTARAGTMVMKNEDGTPIANIFFTSYTKDGENPARRPVTFTFNGGPGSSSVWLHMGAFGPKRVDYLDAEGHAAKPPYRAVDNEDSILDVTDLVFIDPVTTGFSRAIPFKDAKKFHGVDADIESVGEFIRLWVTRNQRWSSPKFLAGESYGTTRAAGLAAFLNERFGMQLNGVVLLSTVLNFQNEDFHVGNDMPYIIHLPTYAATAWYHKKLPADLQQKPLRAVLDEVERWALGDYTLALAKGDRLSGAERQTVVDTLARYTGLEKEFLDQSDLRVEIQRFDKELLRDQKRTVGRLDSRFQGVDALAAGERPDFDPSLAAIRPPYTAMFNDYVRGDLGYKSDLTYHILGGGIGAWDWGTNNGFADVSESLRSAFAKNPHMKLMVAKGYYDLATPYFAVEYTLSHMGLDPGVRGNVRTREYEGGHMMYIARKELAKLHVDVAVFLHDATAR